MENLENKKEVGVEEVAGTPAILKKMSNVMAEQSDELNASISDLPRVNDGAPGFNPTPAELASVFEDIKAEIEDLGNGL
ncbi:MAG: hypothetical protein ABR884_00075 [Minisyncoccia bacterium]|jgi:hypothetical protein